MTVASRSRQRLGHLISRALPLAWVAAATLACGPGLLTPDEVRRHLESPSGTVSSESMGYAVDDFFRAQKASEAEAQASFIKSSESSGDGAAAWAAGILAEGQMEKAASLGAFEDIGDLFCAAGLVSAISAFDSCSPDQQNCQAELVIDSCVLRIGSGGDELARGKIRFRVRNQNNDEYDRSELRIEFEGFESTRNAEAGETQYFQGLIAVESTSYTSEDREEVIFACDLEQQRRNQERGLFNDGILQQEKLSVALRFSAQSDEDSAEGALELLAFVDDSADRRDQSVVLSFRGNARRIDAESSISGASLSVRGSNGEFTCSWNSASQADAEGGRAYSSEGNCVDAQSGETFTWDSTVELQD